MRVVSLWQPWATLIARGAKQIETRSWPTTYRGELAIHAGGRCIQSELRGIANDPAFLGALDVPPWQHQVNLASELPFGAIVAIARLTRCLRTTEFPVEQLARVHYRPWDAEQRFGWCEDNLGDFTPGRYGWVLEEVRPLSSPIRITGRLGLWSVDRETARQVRESAGVV